MRTIYRLQPTRLCMTLCCWLALTLPAWAQVSIPVAGSAITQTFNSLPAIGTVAFVQNTTVFGVYSERSGTGNILAASDGSTATGGLYSFGSGTSTDRALGSVPFSSAAMGSFAHGLRFKNNTTKPITSLQVSYTGEQWRNSGADPQALTFSYLVSTSPITSLSASEALPSGYIPVSDLDFTGPVSGGGITVGGLNGNDPANRTAISATITSLTIAPGAEIMLRWYDLEQPGSNHGLAIDDVSVTASTLPANTPTLIASPTAIANLGTVVGVTSDPGSYTLTGRNLTGPVTLSVTPGVEISNDPATSVYVSSLVLTPTNGSIDAVILARLTGTAAGPVSATVTNGTSITTATGLLSASVVVTGTVGGSGTVIMTNTTTIAVARSQPNGTSTASLPGGKLAGRVTVSRQFGGNLFYIQDATGGISVFNSTTAVGNLVQLGDSVQVSGVLNTYQGARELDFTSYTIVTGTAQIPTPKLLRLSQLPNYEGQLVSIQSASIGGTGTVLSPGSYPLTSASDNGSLSIRSSSELNGVTKPSGDVTIVGIADRFTSGTVSVTDLSPRILPDISRTILLDQLCGGTTSSGLSPDQTLDISTWNLDFLGATAGVIACASAPISRSYPNRGPIDEDKQGRNVRAVLPKLNADIVVTESVSDEVRYAAIVRSLPGSYSYVCSDRFSYYPLTDCDQPINSDGTVAGPIKFAEKVCVLYNRATVTPILAESKALLTDNYSYPRANDWSSGRLPYLFVANVTIGGLTRKIHVVGIQAKAGSTLSDYQRRVADVAALKAELDRNYANTNLILLGDYNDQITGSTTTGKPSSFSAFDADVANYQVLTKSLETTGCITVNSTAGFTDHITISSELALGYVGNSAAVLLPATGIEGPYATTTSDHNPVSARFSLAALPGPTGPLAATITVTPGQVAGTATLLATVTGGTAPYSYVFSGPGNITLNGNTATVTGLPTTGVQSFTVRVSDASGQTVIATTTDKSSTTALCDNVFLGTEAGASTTTGCSNVAIGTRALFANQTGRDNVVVGDSAGFRNTVSANIFIGKRAGFFNTTGTQITMVGDSAGFYGNGPANTFVGYKTGFNTTTGGYNTFMGDLSGFNATTGSANVFIGSQSGFNTTTGSANVFMGQQTGISNTTGAYNLFMGNGSGGANTTGSGNTALGDGSGLHTTSGQRNVSVGQYAGMNNQTGSDNVFIGYGARAGAVNPTNLTNAVAIGANAVVSQSNAIVLGNGANVGIGTSTPTARLEIKTGIGGMSGLKFTNLTGSSATTVNTTKFLTLDAAGNVILASYGVGGRVGVTDSFWEQNGNVLQNTSGDAVVIGNNISKTPVGYKLFVEGGILTERLKIALNNTREWSDFVFAPGYRLRPLAEVETFVNTHRHLPGVPSADEVVKDGMDVGKMNAKLLEKIEETMLYLMQMNKRVEQLEKENRQLKRQLSKRPR